MIPDTMPYGASQGEKRVFSILQNLPDDYIVYSEANISGRNPDFIVIGPDLGILVIEAKGWYAKNILGGDSHNIITLYNGRESKAKHPLRQAKEYMYSLMDYCSENHELYGKLIHHEGANQGKFIFPLGYMAIMNNITEDQLINHPSGNLRTIFPEKNVLTRDALLDTWENLTSRELAKELKKYFEVMWKFPKMNDEMINALRSIIHPEIIIHRNKESRHTNLSDIKVLDTKQENNARSIGSGHRIIYGVAGSGKTVLLISRVKTLANQQRSAKILVLCYNVSFAAYLKGQLQDFDNVDVFHFDAWVKKYNVAGLSSLGDGENNEQLGKDLLDHVENDVENKYDAVMIDEAQDFSSSWFQCALAAMKDPLDGDLLIVGDGNQGLYKGKKVSWKQLGIRAAGRTIHSKFDLDKNYRNTKEILDLAQIFINDIDEKRTNKSQEADDIISIAVDPKKSLRENGQFPILHIAENREAEATLIAKVIEGLLDNSLNLKGIDGKIEPEDIGILYRLVQRDQIEHIKNLKKKIEKICPVVWINDKNKDSRKEIMEPGVKIQTMHSSKGLQYKIVFIMWADQMPPSFPDTDINIEKKLMYVALTRAEDLVVITSSGESKFVQMVKNFPKVQSI